ncbi:MAG: nucleotidyltransferase domain-containing protein [Candidatus Nanopelagicales bacterium]|nr:nucleotidyltransferase domain-containing protein [Candidatus Nanopelagicales bacterium]
MNPDLVGRKSEIETLCRRYRVRRLELFGSATTDRYRPGDSDLDFLVEFEPLPVGAYADTYFGLLEALELLFGVPADLVVGSAIRNPFFRQSVDQTKALLYAA